MVYSMKSNFLVILNMADLKRVYAAVDEDTALQELDRFDEIWGTAAHK